MLPVMNNSTHGQNRGDSAEIMMNGTSLGIQRHTIEVKVLLPNIAVSQTENRLGAIVVIGLLHLGAINRASSADALPFLCRASRR